MLDELLNIQDRGARVTVLGDINDPIYAYFNPSIAYDGKGKLRINIRSCNFAVKRHGMYYYRDNKSYSITKNLYGYIDPDTLKITGLKEIKHSDDTPKEIVRSGIEDVRLFWRDDGMHFAGVRVDTRPLYKTPAQQCEFVMDEATGIVKYLRTMLAESPARAEKNWLPTDKPGKFEYNYSPKQVYDGKRVVGERYDGFIHGSSQLLWQPKSKTYLAMLHSKHHNPLVIGRAYDNMIYVHYFAEYNEAGLLVRISEPFKLGLLDNIEFVAGMVEHKGDLLFSFGAGDARFGIGRIKKENAIEMLAKYDGIDHKPLPPLTKAQARYIERETFDLRRQPAVRRVRLMHNQ